MKVRVHRLGQLVDPPRKASAGSAGFDLEAALDAPVVLAPGVRTLVPTGIALEMPASIEAQVRPRSGLALRHGVTVLNSPGTIDSDYRGEIRVVLINLGEEPFTIQPRARIAQIVFARVEDIEWQEVEELAVSSRGEGGFGSTGV